MPDEPLTINYKRGFTLIELLIVIALIGILSSFGVFSYQSSQKKARDAQRKSDLQMVKKALEAARNDCLSGSYYPANSAGNPRISYSSFLIPYLTDTNFNYLSQTVNDPLTSQYYNYYKSTYDDSVCPYWSVILQQAGGIKTYVLQAKLEINKDPDTNNSRTQCSNAISQITFATPPAADDGYFYVCPD